MPFYRTPLAVITHDHAPSGRKGPQPGDAAKTSYVNRYGDPLGLKSNTWVSLLSPCQGPARLHAVAELRRHASVERERSRDVGCTSSHPAELRGSVSGKIVVVACSAIEIGAAPKALCASTGTELRCRASIRTATAARSLFLDALLRRRARADASGASINPRRSTPTGRPTAAQSDEFLEANGLWAGAAIYNNTSDRRCRCHCFAPRQSDLDTLWNGFHVRISLCERTGSIRFLDDEFGRGLSISFMANQVPAVRQPHRAASDREGQMGATGRLCDQDYGTRMTAI